MGVVLSDSRAKVTGQKPPGTVPSTFSEQNPANPAPRPGGSGHLIAGVSLLSLVPRIRLLFLSCFTSL